MEIKNNGGLVVMSTHHDQTVGNAQSIFEECKDSLCECWGMKEVPLPLTEMKQLYAEMKQCGKTTFLEIVAYTEKDGLEGAEMAVECGCDFS